MRATTVTTIHDLTRWIRDYGHDARHLPRLISNEFLWHQIWTAVDIIDDVDLALTAHLASKFPSNDGERYLRTYGVMQGLFLQQDALLDLIKAIHPKKKIKESDVLKDIREARNASVGHPTQLRRNGVLSAHAIVRHSMSKEGFELHSYPRKQDRSFDYISIETLIKKQRLETIRILTDAVNDLRDQERLHRDSFKDIKLMGTFDQVGRNWETGNWGKRKLGETGGQTERFRIAVLHDGAGYVRGNVPSVPRLLSSSNLEIVDYH